MDVAIDRSSLEEESGLIVLPPAGGAEEALQPARPSPPDVALLDVSLRDGLSLCLELKRQPAASAVLL